MKIIYFLFVSLILLWSSFSVYAQTYNMPSGTQSTCTGFFFDSGGAGADYASSETKTFTICPSTAGASVSVLFNSFDTESGFDFLAVFNGNSTAAPPFAGSPYSGTGIATGTVFTSTAANGCLTFQFTSDGSVTHAGWQAEVRCGCSNYTLSAVTPTSCVGASPMTLTIGGTLTYAGATGNVQLLLNGSPVGAAVPRTASPMALSIPGVVYTPPAPFIISAQDVNFPSTCISSGTVFVNAGTDVSLACGTTTTTLTGSGGGSWTFVSGPSVPVITTPASGTSGVTGMTNPGTYILRRTNTIGACTFRDEVTITIPSCVTMTNTTINTCSTVLLDPGGAANYPASNTTTTTICPSGTGNAQITFTAFDTESGFDFVTVYDGNSVAGAVLATLSGTDGLNKTYTATNATGCLTVKFTSDGGTQKAGFQADVRCACKVNLTSVVMSGCSGAPTSLFNMATTFTHGGGSAAGFRIAINGTWVSGVLAYGVSPQTVNLAGLSHSGTDPIVVKIVDMGDATCNSSLTLLDAGSNTTKAMCSGSTTTNLTAATAGTWSLASAPAGAVVAIATPAALTTSVSGLTILGDYVFNRSVTLNGCVFRDKVTVSVLNCLTTFSADQVNICTGYLSSHATYPANYAANTTQSITLCPTTGAAVQLSFESIALGTTSDFIDIYYNSTGTGTPAYSFDSGDNGRTVTVASTDVNGCMTVKFRTDASNQSSGFLARISCRLASDLVRSGNCSAAPPLCMDGNNYFPSATGSASGNTGIPLGCASTLGPSWFYFQSNTTGPLNFTITPVSMPSAAPFESGDDYDFAVWGPFTSQAAIPCSATPANNANMGTPIRCNFSATKGQTGLGPLGVNSSESAGGIPWSTPFNIVAGQFYVLMVDDFSTGGNGFNIVSSTPSVTNCSIILPVEWTYFGAEKNGAHNLVTWRTSMERQNSYFEIQASLTGEHFETIGSVKGGLGNYSFVHEKPSNLVYYRIKQVDESGLFTFTNIVSVKRENMTFGNLICKPNPTEGRITLEYNLTEESMTSILVYSTSGILLKTIEVQSKNGFNEQEIDLSDYPQGMYLLKLICLEGVMNAKVIKK